MHIRESADLTIGVLKTSVQIELGVLTIDDLNLVTNYDEKPQKSYAASMGIYVFSPGVRSRITPGEYLDAPTLVLDLIKEGRRIVSFCRECDWIDMGNSGQLERANHEFLEDPEKYLPSLSGNRG
jgi:NDP-sugar pyrophosphorylase family protein